MKKIIINILWIWFLIITGASPVPAAGAIDTLTSAGTVEMAVKVGVDWKPLAVGGALEAGAAVRTGKDGNAVLRWLDGDAVKLAPETELTFLSVSKDASGKELTELELKKGRIFVKTKKLATPDSGLRIVTPTAVAGIRETEFMVEITDENKATFAVLDGQITVEAQNITVILDASYQISVESTQPPGEIFSIAADLKDRLDDDSHIVGQALSAITVAAAAPTAETPKAETGKEAAPVTAQAAPAAATATAGTFSDNQSGKEENVTKKPIEKPKESAEEKKEVTAVPPIKEEQPAPVAKVESQPTAKTESQPAEKTEPQPVAKAEPTPAAKTETKPAAKTETKTQPAAKTETKPQPPATGETKKPAATAKPESKPAAAAASFDDQAKAVSNELDISLLHENMIDFLVDEIHMSFDEMR